MELMIATHHRLVAKFAASRCATKRTGILPSMPLQAARICTTTARPQHATCTPDFYRNNSCCDDGVFDSLQLLGLGKLYTMFFA
jgi:hypothetical protein